MATVDETRQACRTVAAAYTSLGQLTRDAAASVGEELTTFDRAGFPGQAGRLRAAHGALGDVETIAGVYTRQFARFANHVAELRSVSTANEVVRVLDEVATDLDRHRKDSTLVAAHLSGREFFLDAVAHRRRLETSMAATALGALDAVVLTLPAGEKEEPAFASDHDLDIGDLLEAVVRHVEALRNPAQEPQRRGSMAS